MRANAGYTRVILSAAKDLAHGDCQSEIPCVTEASGVRSLTVFAVRDDKQVTSPSHRPRRALGR